MEFTVNNRDGLYITATDPFPTNVGGAGGPKIVSCSFELAIGRGGRSRVLLSADLDRSDFQDASAIRRRTARAAVGLGRRTADAIEGGTLKYDLGRKRAHQWAPPSEWVRLSFWNAEVYEGHERRADGRLEFKFEPIADPPEVTRAQIEMVVSSFRQLADALHVSVDRPDNRHIFGAP